MLKTLGSRIFRRAGQDGGEPLISPRTDLTMGDVDTQSFQTHPPSSPLPTIEDYGQASLLVLQQLLMDRSVEKAEGEQQRTLEVWRGMNAVGGEQGASYPPSWIKEFQQMVQQAATRHFPSLPPEGSTQQQQQELHTYLHHIQEVLTGELLRLAPLLREACLLAAVIDSYHVHTMSQLERLLQRELDSDQLFTLLRWTLKTYLSKMLSHPDAAAAPDLLLLTDWLQRARTKALHSTQVM
ncbi:uncharacterized protein LOC134444041 [Engraulis encrasicolus]|uniref:uncharacterized protein LOC134444041 n=1 Tax=Engraulis encrasicolus TaxID=184585 RepID=UPI002FD372E9